MEKGFLLAHASESNARAGVERVGFDCLGGHACHDHARLCHGAVHHSVCTDLGPVCQRYTAKDFRAGLDHRHGFLGEPDTDDDASLYTGIFMNEDVALMHQRQAGADGGQRDIESRQQTRPFHAQLQPETSGPPEKLRMSVRVIFQRPEQPLIVPWDLGSETTVACLHAPERGTLSQDKPDSQRVVGSSVGYSPAPAVARQEDSGRCGFCAERADGATPLTAAGIKVFSAEGSASCWWMEAAPGNPPSH